MEMNTDVMKALTVYEGSLINCTEYLVKAHALSKPEYRKNFKMSSVLEQMNYFDIKVQVKGQRNITSPISVHYEQCLKTYSL